MKFYDITYIIDDEQQEEKLSALAKRFEKINGWSEKEILQFAVIATSKRNIETKLQFLEYAIANLEKNGKEQKKKQKYISDEEHEKCKRVVSAYEESLDDMNISVVDAGKFGFVKLINYKFPYGFEAAISYTDSDELFSALWDEWVETQLLKFIKKTPIAKMDYEDIIKCLFKNKEGYIAKREYFAKKAGIST